MEAREGDVKATIYFPNPLGKRRAAVIILLIAGIGGSGVTFWFHYRANIAHDKEVKGLREDNRKVTDRVTALSGQTDLILQILAVMGAKKPEDELTRRLHILAALRNEYIVHHDNVSSAIISGTAQPPADWVNKRLKELGEKWAIPRPTEYTSTAEIKSVDVDLKLLERAVQAVESCNAFVRSSINRMKEAETDIQRHNADPGVTEEMKASYAHWATEKYNGDDIKLYHQTYGPELIEVRRLLALKGAVSPSRPSNDYENPKGMGGIADICDELSDMTQAYINREYGLGKITLEEGRQYFVRMRRY